MSTFTPWLTLVVQKALFLSIPFFCARFASLSQYGHWDKFTIATTEAPPFMLTIGAPRSSKLLFLPLLALRQSPSIRRTHRMFHYSILYPLGSHRGCYMEAEIYTFCEKCSQLWTSYDGCGELLQLIAFFSGCGTSDELLAGKENISRTQICRCKVNVR